MSSTRTSSRWPVWTVPLAIGVVAAVLLAVSLLNDGGGEREAAPPPGDDGSTQEPTDGGSAQDGPAAEVVEPEEAPAAETARRDAEDPLAVGPPDAPVAMVVYSDFQCPYCASWSEATLPTMLEHAEAGDLRVEFRDLNVFGPDSLRAAQAAYAAGLQGKYLEYHGALLEDGETRPTGELSAEALVSLAGDLGLDADRFAADLDSAEVADGVQENIDESVSLGVYSTPAFLLGETPILGAQPTDVFEQAFQDELARAGG